MYVDVRDVTIGTPWAAVNWLLNGVRVVNGKEVWLEVEEFGVIEMIKLPGKPLYPVT